MESRIELLQQMQVAMLAAYKQWQMKVIANYQVAAASILAEQEVMAHVTRPYLFPDDLSCCVTRVSSGQMQIEKKGQVYSVVRHSQQDGKLKIYLQCHQAVLPYLM